eukprot:jgi/Tetstr1/440864/TSEL_029137.t1
MSLRDKKFAPGHLLKPPEHLTSLVRELQLYRYGIGIPGVRGLEGVGVLRPGRPARTRERHYLRDTRAGPGYCELLNVEPALPGGEDGAVAITKRRALRRGCEAFPVEVSCGDAPEFLDFAAAADNHLEPGWEPPEPGSRGIVIAVSDGLLISAYAVVRLLRAHGCKLPIDLWAFPDELTEASREALKELTLVLRQLPVRDPTYLFDSHEFLEAGTIFWPDFWNPGNSIFGVTRHSHVWELLGVPFVDMFEQESGQLLVNRARHVAPLHLMMYYAKPDKLLWRWKLVWGDKDLFRLA